MEKINEVKITGSLKYPKYFENDKYKKLDFALDTRVGKIRCFFTCIAWGDVAEVIYKNCPEGNEIGLTGYLKKNDYVDKNGIKKSETQIVVSEYEIEQPMEEDTSYSSIDFEAPKIEDNGEDCPF